MSGQVSETRLQRQASTAMVVFEDFLPEFGVILCMRCAGIWITKCEYMIYPTICGIGSPWFYGTELVLVVL